MNIAEKWQEYKDWKKAKFEELQEKHPKVADTLVKTKAIVTVGLIFGATYAVGYYDGHKSFEQKLIAAADEAKKEKENPTLAPWKEEYRDTYMKARDFGDSLTMEKGEQIILSDSSVYNDPTLKPVIIDHYVNGKPCYPPDEDIKWLP